MTETSLKYVKYVDHEENCIILLHLALAMINRINQNDGKSTSISIHNYI